MKYVLNVSRTPCSKCKFRMEECPAEKDQDTIINYEAWGLPHGVSDIYCKAWRPKATVFRKLKSMVGYASGEE